MNFTLNSVIHSYVSQQADLNSDVLCTFPLRPYLTRLHGNLNLYYITSVESIIYIINNELNFVSIIRNYAYINSDIYIIYFENNEYMLDEENFFHEYNTVHNNAINSTSYYNIKRIKAYLLFNDLNYQIQFKTDENNFTVSVNIINTVRTRVFKYRFGINFIKECSNIKKYQNFIDSLNQIVNNINNKIKESKLLIEEFENNKYLDDLLLPYSTINYSYSDIINFRKIIKNVNNYRNQINENLFNILLNFIKIKGIEDYTIILPYDIEINIKKYMSSDNNTKGINNMYFVIFNNFFPVTEDFCKLLQSRLPSSIIETIYSHLEFKHLKLN